MPLAKLCTLIVQSLAPLLRSQQARQCVVKHFTTRQTIIPAHANVHVVAMVPWGCAHIRIPKTNTSFATPIPSIHSPRSTPSLPIRIMSRSPPNVTSSPVHVVTALSFVAVIVFPRVNSSPALSCHNHPQTHIVLHETHFLSDSLAADAGAQPISRVVPIKHQSLHPSSFSTLAATSTCMSSPWPEVCAEANKADPLRETMSLHRNANLVPAHCDSKPPRPSTSHGKAWHNIKTHAQSVTPTPRLPGGNDAQTFCEPQASSYQPFEHTQYQCCEGPAWPQKVHHPHVCKMRMSLWRTSILALKAMPWLRSAQPPHAGNGDLANPQSNAPNTTRTSKASTSLHPWTSPDSHLPPSASPLLRARTKKTSTQAAMETHEGAAPNHTTPQKETAPRLPLIDAQQTRQSFAPEHRKSPWIGDPPKLVQTLSHRICATTRISQRGTPPTQMPQTLHPRRDHNTGSKRYRHPLTSRSSVSQVSVQQRNVRRCTSRRTPEKLDDSVACANARCTCCKIVLDLSFCLPRAFFPAGISCGSSSFGAPPAGRRTPEPAILTPFLYLARVGLCTSKQPQTSKRITSRRQEETSTQHAGHNSRACIGNSWL